MGGERERERLFLQETFSEYDVKEVIWNSNTDVIPGPDVFGFSFFKCCWEIIKADVLGFTNHFHLKDVLPKAVTSFFLTMIPKHSNPQKLQDYKPICLIRSLYKILSKLLAARLKKVVTGLVSHCQSTFISQRHIQDGVLVVNEIMDYAKRFKKNYLVVKIDFKQAYDCLSWNYLRHILKTMNFGIKKWMNWMETLVFGNSLSILVNGSPNFEFKVSHGFRQGDLISSFLFILATKGIAGMMRSVVLSGDNKGFSLNKTIQFDILEFADDTIML